MKLKLKRQVPKRKEYVNIKEAAAIIGVCYRTLKTAMDNGEIPFQKISARKYIFRVDALEGLAGRKND